MYEAHVAEQPFGEFEDKDHAIYDLSQEYNLDVLEQISLNNHGICANGLIVLTRVCK